MIATSNPPELPHDMFVEIAGHVAARSPRPMDDVSSLRASCRAMLAACGERAVGRRVALEREAAAMRWADAARYRAVVEQLARAGNPEACFLAGLTLVFAEKDRRARAAGHHRLARAAAYVLGLLMYNNADAGDAAARYIRQVEGDVEENNAAEGGHDVAKKRVANGECERCRAQAVEAVREVTWNVSTVPPSGPGPVAAMSNEEEHRCTGAGCGAPQGWSNCLGFCSEECRIRHEYAQFFSMVPLPVPVA